MLWAAFCHSSNEEATYGLSVRQCITGGAEPCFNVSAAARAPWAPAAPSVWPKQAFTEPAQNEAGVPDSKIQGAETNALCGMPHSVGTRSIYSAPPPTLAILTQCHSAHLGGSKRPSQGSHFNRVPKRCASAMHGHKVNIVRLDPSTLQCSMHKCGLCRAIWCRETAAAPILVACRPCSGMSRSLMVWANFGAHNHPMFVQQSERSHKQRGVSYARVNGCKTNELKPAHRVLWCHSPCIVASGT